MLKKGMSHIEQILAFILFIGAMITLLYFFDVPESKLNVNSDIDETFYNIERLGASPLIVQGVKIYPSTKNNLSIEFGLDLSEYNVSAIDYSGNIINASIVNATTGKICLKPQDGASPLNSFVYIYLNNELNENFAATGCTEEDKDKYDFAASYTLLTFSKKSIGQLQYEYYNNYTNLKSLFKIPKNRDFSFPFKYIDGTIANIEINIPQGVDVIAKDYKINVLNPTSRTAELANLKVKIW